jgi:hypothetical protein
MAYPPCFPQFRIETGERKLPPPREILKAQDEIRLTGRDARDVDPKVTCKRIRINRL